MPDDYIEPDNQHESRSGRQSWRRPAATFGLGVAALAGMISLAVPVASPTGKNTEVTVQAIVAASNDAPINMLAFTACTSPTTVQCPC